MAYFSNSTDGDVLDAQCADCPLGNKPCPVLNVQLTFNYKQCDKGQEQLRAAMNLLIDEKGICQLRPMLVKSEPLADPLAWMDDAKLD